MRLKLISDTRPRDYSLKDIRDKRRKVLVKRDVGGLGDILVHRMIFEDFKIAMPDCHVTFACPKSYFQAVADHPFIDDIVDCDSVDARDFLVHYNTSTACVKYEMTTMPRVDKHRSDMWAEHCGLTLTRHSMHIRLLKEETEWATNKLKNMSGGRPTVLVAPVTAMSSKNIEDEQISPVVKTLEGRGFYVFGVHNLPLYYNMPTVTGLNTRQFMSFVNCVDYVIAGDTAAFHLAGGLGKPTVLVAGWADGKVLSKHYKNVSVVQKHRDDMPEWTCGPCHNPHTCCMQPDKKLTRKPCMTEITPDMILAGFDKLANT